MTSISFSFYFNVLRTWINILRQRSSNNKTKSVASAYKVRLQIPQLSINIPFDRDIRSLRAFRYPSSTWAPNVFLSDMYSELFSMYFIPFTFWILYSYWIHYSNKEQQFHLVIGTSKGYCSRCKSHKLPILGVLVLRYIYVR